MHFSGGRVSPKEGPAYAKTRSMSRPWVHRKGQQVSGWHGTGRKGDGVPLRD